MPVKQPQKLTSWSFSRFYTWRECARKAKYKFIDKLKEPEGPALAKGNAIHKLAENYATGRSGSRLPKELIAFGAEFKELRKHKEKILVEQQWAMTDKWTPTGWFGSDAWCRVILDAAKIDDKQAHVIDHKTGKIYPYHSEQLSLFALATFKLNAQVEEVKTSLWYLDQGEEVSEVYKLADVPKLQKEWEKKVKPMLADSRFPINPGSACKWCHFKKANGGPCEV